MATFIKPEAESKEKNSLISFNTSDLFTKDDCIRLEEVMDNLSLEHHLDFDCEDERDDAFDYLIYTTILFLMIKKVTNSVSRNR